METAGSSALLAPTRMPSAAPPVSSTAPSIDSDLDAEFHEPAEDRMRRHEWIRYYVRENDLQKAFDLGWDGKPFRVTSSCTLGASTEELAATQSEGASAAVGAAPAAAGASDTEATLHRI